MFGINLEELIVLAVLAFILFGPQKLPEYAAKLGRLVAKLRAASTEVTQQFQNPFQYPPEPGQQKPTEPTPYYATCPACHQTIGPDFTFCPNCGHRVKAESSPAPPPEPPKPAS
jgi:Sec-independent protein translocase protein TatA